MFTIDKMITGIEVSIMFNEGNITAGRPEDTLRMLLIESYAGSLFEDVDFNRPDIVVYPFIEDGAEKCSPRLSWNAGLVYAAFCVRLRLNQRQKVDVFCIDPLEESIDLKEKLDIMCVHHTEDICIELASYLK
jgi:hypothetical protein